MKIKKRIDTINLLIQSMSSIKNSDKIDIKQELKNVLNIDNMQPQERRNLIRIFFTSRATDTFLRSFLENYSLRDSNMYSIGKYIKRLSSHNISAIAKLSLPERDNYIRTIANVRNNFLHKANAYPAGNAEVNKLLTEIHTLITRVSTL